MQMMSKGKGRNMTDIEEPSTNFFFVISFSEQKNYQLKHASVLDQKVVVVFYLPCP